METIMVEKEKVEEDNNNNNNVIIKNQITPSPIPIITTDTIPSTNTGSATIQVISTASIQRIVAGQAIYDLASCIKELIDNSIDAQSTTINST